MGVLAYSLRLMLLMGILCKCRKFNKNVVWLQAFKACGAWGCLYDREILGAGAQVRGLDPLAVEFDLKPQIVD